LHKIALSDSEFRKIGSQKGTDFLGVYMKLRVYRRILLH